MREHEVACPACAHLLVARIAESVNGGRSPALRQAILDCAFQRFVCVQCAAPFEVVSPFSYIDFPRKLWLGVFPLAWEQRWPELEDEPRRVWQAHLVEHAPPFIKPIGEGLHVRAVFGLDALREKILCLEAGIDDRLLEALKLDVMRAEGRISPLARRRLVALDDGTFTLSAAVPGGDRLQLRRDLLRDRATEAWLPLLARLEAGPYVDLGRLLQS